MKKIVLFAVFLSSALVAAPIHTSLSAVSEREYIIKNEVGPRKKYNHSYRSNMAQAYFGNSKCRNWKRFCGR